MSFTEFKHSIVVFQHLAKTGGTTLGNIFLRNFQPHEMLAITPSGAASALGTWPITDLIRALNQSSADHLARIRFVGGHIPFGIHSLFQRRARYVTLLRDPVDRLISGFYYSVPDGRLPGGEAVTFADYVHRKRHYDLGVNNAQLRVISGVPDLDPVERVTTATAREPNEKDWERVRDNIRQHYGLIGTTERFDEFLVLLCAGLGWHLANVAYTPQNVTAGRPARSAIPDEVVAAIERQNIYDRRLHTLAQRLLDEEIARYGPTFSGDLALFRHLNQMSANGASADVLRTFEATHRTRRRANNFLQ